MPDVFLPCLNKDDDDDDDDEVGTHPPPPPNHHHHQDIPVIDWYHVVYKELVEAHFIS